MFGKSSTKHLLLACTTLALCGSAYAATDLSGIAGQVTGQIKQLAELLVIVAYVAGIGFALVGVIQFKAHKDNPAQVPLSKPIVYLGVGACLLFLPAVMGSAGKTIFGDKATGADAAKQSASISDGLTWS